MKYSQQRELVEDLRTLADFFEKPESIVFDYPYGLTTHYISANVSDWNPNTRESVFNADKTLAKLRRIARALGSHEKKYIDTDFALEKKFGHNLKIKVSAGREAVCKRTLVGVETIPARVVPATEREIYEWECEPVSLLADL